MNLHDFISEKLNTNVTFKYQEDIEGDSNRGWKVDKIEAFLDDKPVGYLKLSYIPKERFEKYYPNIFNYLSQINGMTVLPYEYRKTDYHKIPLEELRKTLPYALIALDNYPAHKEANKIPLDQVLPEYEKLERVAKKKYGLQFKQFHDYFVNKPFVDYINIEPEFRRQGIGTALHRAGYEWMKSRGLPYYASGTQTDSAKEVWKDLEQKYPTEIEKTRYLNRPIQRRKFAG